MCETDDLGIMIWMSALQMSAHSNTSVADAWKYNMAVLLRVCRSSSSKSTLHKC